MILAGLAVLIGLQPSRAGDADGRPAVKAEGRKTQRPFRDCPDCPEMVVIPAGSFMMGRGMPMTGATVRKVRAIRSRCRPSVSASTP
jgi:hypothetical protein